MEYYIQGLMMGLAYVAPIGVQNLFVINSAIVNACRRAFVTAGIVIFFDVTLSLGCFFGIGAILTTFPILESFILLIGSLLILYMGVSICMTKPATLQRTQSQLTLKKTVTTACVVTWCNPQAIIDGTMLLGAFRVSMPIESSTAFMTGVANASILWFCSLTVAMHLFRKKCTPPVFRAINLLSGTIVIGYSLHLLYQFMLRLL